MERKHKRSPFLSANMFASERSCDPKHNSDDNATEGLIHFRWSDAILASLVLKLHWSLLVSAHL